MRPAQKRTRRALLGIMVFALLNFMYTTAFCGRSPESLFEQARSTYRSMLSKSAEDQSAEGWKNCIHLFQKVMEADPHHRYSDRCLYLTAQSYHHLYDASHSATDLASAREYYRKLVHNYPTSPLADDAQYLLGILYLEDDPAQAYIELVKVGLFFPNGDMRSRAAGKAFQLKKQLGCDGAGQKVSSERNASNQVAIVATGPTPDAPAPSSSSGRPAGTQMNTPPSCPKPNQLEDIQHWSGDNYTRVVLYLSSAADFEQHSLAAEPKIKVPARIYLDLKNCLINPRLKPKIPIGNRLLQGVRLAQYDTTQARVVLDIESMESYKIFSLSDPYRLIIDVRGKQPLVPQVAKRTPRKGKRESLPSLAQQLGLAVRRIVLDPGHGGKDKGAIGPHKIYEKDIALKIAKRLKTILETETGCKVILTRTKDHFLTLEERTAIANVEKADLFISIHTNAHRDRQLCGTETYFLNLSKDKESARVAAYENATSTRKISDLEGILKKLMLHSKINESRRLAKDVQNNIIGELKPKYSHLRNLGVKQAPFHVLIGAEMPAILIETAFITNEREERLLRDKKFQQYVAQGIASGIESYMQEMSQFAQVGEHP